MATVSERRSVVHLKHMAAELRARMQGAIVGYGFTRRKTVVSWAKDLDDLIQQMDYDLQYTLVLQGPPPSTAHHCHDQYCYDMTRHACHQEGCKG